MFKRKAIKRYKRQVLALVEKEIFHVLRYKSQLISRFLNPIIQLFVLIFIFSAIFNVKAGFKLGYWDANNYSLFLLIAFCLQFSRSITRTYERLLRREKYMKTLSAMMVAPMNRFTLLLGILISEFLLNSIPTIILFIIAYILYPISIYFILLAILIYFLIFLILASFGLIIGVYSISHEDYVPYLTLFFRIILLFSCTHYPKEIFPTTIQYLVLLNPFYYIFDLMRLTWYLGVNYEVALANITLSHLIIFISLVIFSPITSVYLFNRVFKKYGITGY